MESATVNNTGILFTSGSTDMPGFDIEQATNTWVNDLYYGDFSTSYFNVATADLTINFNDGATGTLINKYKAQLQVLGFGGKTTTLVASGFKNPGNNSNGPAFGLYFAPLEGGALIPLPIEPVNVNEVNNNLITISPNPATDILYIPSLNSITNTTGYIYDVTGEKVLSINDIRTNSVNISALEKGMYFVILEGDGKTKYGKFIKQ